MAPAKARTNRKGHKRSLVEESASASYKDLPVGETLQILESDTFASICLPEIFVSDVTPPIKKQRKDNSDQSTAPSATDQELDQGDKDAALTMDDATLEQDTSDTTITNMVNDENDSEKTEIGTKDTNIENLIAPEKPTTTQQSKEVETETSTDSTEPPINSTKGPISALAFRRAKKAAAEKASTNAAAPTTDSTNPSSDSTNPPVSAVAARRAKKLAAEKASTDTAAPITDSTNPFSDSTNPPVSAVAARRAKELAAKASTNAAAPTTDSSEPPINSTKGPISALAFRRAKKLAAEKASTNAAALTTDSTNPSSDSTNPPVSAVAARRAKKLAAEKASTDTAAPITDSTNPFSDSTNPPVSAVAARRAKELAAKASTDTAEPPINSTEISIDTTTTTISSDRIPGKIFNSPPRLPELSSPLQSTNLSDTDYQSVDDNEDTDVFVTPTEQMEEEEITLTDEDQARGVSWKNEERKKKAQWKAINKLLDPYSVSTYSPENATPFEHEGETYYCIGFEKGQQLVFLGYSLVGTLFGSIDIAGATISSSHDIPTQPNQALEPSHTVSFFPVFSPRTSALTVVRSIPYENTAIVSPSPTLTSIYSDLNPLLESFMPRWDTLESIIIVKNMEWCGVEQLEIVNPSLKNLFRLDNKKDFVLNDGPQYQDMVGFQPIIKVTPEVRAMKIEPSWSARVDDVLKFEQDCSAPSVSMVCGTKNVGKSSFARYMINRLLKIHQRVAYLETDVGQTEFTPSGLVSLNIVESPLLGPAFTHLNLKSKQSFFIGSTSPKNDSTYYQDCIHQLLKTYRKQADSLSDQDVLLPLVVNTSGWIKGLGYDLLLKVAEYVEPTHIFSLRSASGGFGQNLPDYFADHVTASQQSSPSDHPPVLLNIEAPTMTTSDNQSMPALPNQRQRRPITPSTMADKYQAVDQRNLMMISYMYHDAQAFGTRQQGRGWWNVNPRLVNRVPWTIDWRQHLQGIWVLFEDVPLSQLLYALNGSLVGLIGKTEGKPMELKEEKDASTKGENDSASVIPPKYYSPMTSAPPNPSTTTCYGLGIIRAIDPEQHRIHLLTPLPLDQLCHVNALVKGELDIPVHIMLDQYVGARNQNCGVPWRQVPYLSHDVIDSIGSSAPRLRRNVMRRSQQRIG